MSDDRNNIYVKTTITMNDGRTFDGEVILALGGVLERTLNNNEAKVLAFRDADGQRFLTKAYIVEIVEHKKER